MPQDDDVPQPKLANLKYLVTSILGAGPLGTVMQIADKTPSGGRYALRVIKHEESGVGEIERARAELDASRKLNHPSILACYDFRLRRSWFKVSRAELLMEYVDGKALDAIEAIELRAAVAVFARVAAALGHMHRRGVFHGNVCPAHVLVSRSGQVKVRRYGLSLVPEKIRGQVTLNLSCIAPEQVREKALDAQTDLYGLGATMYRVLTGRSPGGGPAGRTEGKKISLPTALNPEIPAPLNDLIVACLQSNPGRRPPDMYEAVKRLDGLVKELAIEDDALVGIAADREQGSTNQEPK